MWTCESCGEEHEDQFTSCWKCSQVDTGLTVHPEGDERKESLDDKLATTFACTKCDSRGADSKRIAVTGTGLSKILDLQYNEYIALSCQKCGFTEFYNAEILRDETAVGTLLDLFVS